MTQVLTAENVNAASVMVDERVAAAKDSATIDPRAAALAVRVLAQNYAHKRIDYLKRAHYSGMLAKGIRFRVSPIYEDPGADIFWLAGFDGLTFEQAQGLHDQAYDAGQIKIPHEKGLGTAPVGACASAPLPQEATQ